MFWEIPGNLGEGLDCDSPSFLTGRDNVSKILMKKIYSLSPLAILLGMSRETSAEIISFLTEVP